MAKHTTILNVFFSGTGHKLKEPHLAGFLHEHIEESPTQLKKGFNGCGVEHGFSGVIFGTGTEKDVAEVVQQVQALVKEGKKVKLNAYGHSRGAIAAQLLAKAVAGFDEDTVEINLALMDPVPGNLVRFTKLQEASNQVVESFIPGQEAPLPRNLANQALDLSKCRNLKRVLSLYPYKPLPTLAAHAPVIARYPAHCEVEEDVVSGIHSGAQFQKSFHQTLLFYNGASFATYVRMKNFLEDCGTRFVNIPVNMQVNRKNKGPLKFASSEATSILLEHYKNRVKRVAAPSNHKAASRRDTHARETVFIDSKRGSGEATPFLNRHHRQLEAERGNPNALANDDNKLCLRFVGRSEKQAKTRKIMSVEQLTNSFKDFANIISDEFFTRGRQSRKVKLFKQWTDELNNITTFSDMDSLKAAFRNMLALLLQRDRYALSLFSTTHSASSALNLLKQSEFTALADLVLGQMEGPPRYRDLRTFVLTKNDSSYFNASNRNVLYDKLEKGGLTKDHSVDFLVPQKK